MTDHLLPADWIEYIFSRLTVRYGRAFLARWDVEGINRDLVMADWAKELAGFTNWTEAIDYALDNLPADGKPPTVNEFKAACFRAPKPDRPALPAPKADPVRAKAELGKVDRALKQSNRYTDWIRAGLVDLHAGVKRSPTVERMIREAAAAKGVA